ncbi:uncharacterized protein LOC129769866 [Toxorhynchites rutilus septentrionalis]|uniref:uncharacterized protein LOC129769866 n=1 Tax=Toxorhynchites rutilus septentrionalis TaxID=329112 RepID=UPI002478D410|nr:uncharacterized protein LOC129769866 [Toxorhynchites rutilus septentrionalis]XP_055628346.1 uncharacterized protein LOC129769866 [Toxorhynchites rutilus septentrionalis]
MHHIRTVVRILQTLAVLRCLPCSTAYHIPYHVDPRIQTLGNLLSVAPLQPYQQKHYSPYNQKPLHIFLPPRVDNSSEIDDTARIDRGFHRTRKIVRNHPPRYAHSRSRAPARQPSLQPRYYSTFSKWSPCDTSSCLQRRERHCKVRVKCGFHAQTEQRPCNWKLCNTRSGYKQSPGQKFSVVVVDPSGSKKKKKIIIANDDDDYYEDDNEDTEYVIVKKKPKKKRKGYHRRGENQYRKPVVEYDFQTEHRFQNHRAPLKVALDEFDDQKIFSPSPHFDPKYSTVQKFHRRPHATVLKRRPQWLTDYFEDDDDFDADDGDEYVNRRDDLMDLDGFRPHASHLVGTDDTHSSVNANLSHFDRLLDSFPTAEPQIDEAHFTKREVSNGLDDSSEESESMFSDEDTNSNTTEVGDDAKRYPERNMLKYGAVTQKKAREKAVFEMPRKVDNPYSKWSRWSKCTAKCTTRRFKRCKVPSVCGNDIIREIAYCYTEGSFCEEWIGNQLYQTNKSITTTTTTTTTTTPKPAKSPRNPLAVSLSQVARSRSDVQDNSIAQESFGSRKGYLLPEYMPQEMTCGLPMVRNKPKKYLYNMLRIIGGKASRRGQWPWQVAILNRFKEAFCGGTLVAPRWILTAAHCVRKRLFVRLGEHNLQQPDGTEVEFRIEFSIKHPRYDKKTVDNDVALLRLPHEMERSNFVGYACLPERYQQLPMGHTCTIIGWGKKRHSDDSGTDILHEAEVPIITNDKCRAVYHDYTITKNMFCAGHKRGRIDTCAGDSGGPLLCRDTTKVNSPWTIFGITSFGDGCGKKNKFGIYTKLPNYVDWIWSVINCDGNCRM